MHTIDTSKLEQIFNGLFDNNDKLTAWECDRLQEWHGMWSRGKELTERQLEVLEQMWNKIP
jgi:hypothetical protein